MHDQLSLNESGIRKYLRNKICKMKRINSSTSISERMSKEPTQIWSVAFQARNFFEPSRFPGNESDEKNSQYQRDMFLQHRRDTLMGYVILGKMIQGIGKRRFL